MGEQTWNLAPVTEYRI